MIMQYLGTNLVLINPLIIGLLNLLTPFISKEDSNLRSGCLLFVSVLFLLNTVILDHLFLEGYSHQLTLFTFGKYILALQMDALGLLFLNLLAFLWVCALLYTIKFLNINGMPGSNRFLFFMNLCILVGVFIALSANLFTMFVGYELLTLSTLPLIAHFPNRNCMDGMYRYVKILMLSSLGLFLPAVVIIYHYVGHGDFTAQGFLQGYFSDGWAVLLFITMIFGLAKAAIYPMHSWLPAAMVATYPVSAILHAVVVVKTGLFCIYKIMLYVFGINYLQHLFYDNNILLILPIITIAYSSVKAISYTNIKMMLAYSTINQLNIALLSAFLLTPKGINAAILHMISHSFTKICIFYTAGNMYSVKKAYRIGELIGIRATMPKTSFVMLIASLSLIGIPPFAGFVSKLYILLAAAEVNNLLVMCVVLISSLFSALYVIKMLIFIYRPTKEDFILNLKLKPYFADPEKTGIRERVNSLHRAEGKLPILMIISIGLCMCGVVGFVFVQKMIAQFLLFI